MLENRFEMPVLPHQLGGSFITDPTHSRNVVGGIANQGQIVGDKLRSNTEALISVLRSDPMLLNVCRPATPRVQQPDTRSDELLKILVSGDNYDVDLGLDTLRHQRPDHIVGLIARERNDRNSVGIQHLADAIHAPIEIGLELLCQLFTGRLIGWVTLMPE